MIIDEYLLEIFSVSNTIAIIKNCYFTKMYFCLSVRIIEKFVTYYKEYTLLFFHIFVTLLNFDHVIFTRNINILSMTKCNMLICVMKYVV